MKDDIVIAPYDIIDEDKKELTKDLVFHYSWWKRPYFDGPKNFNEIYKDCKEGWII